MADKASNKTQKEAPASRASKDASATDFAVLEIGGSQLIVHVGDVFEVNKLDAKSGDTIKTKDVLMTKVGDSVQVGEPHVKGAEVEMKVLAQTKGKKIKAFDYKAKSRYRRRWGYRPHLTRIEITQIKA